MAKLRSFLGVFVSLFVLLFSANAFADTCNATNVTESQVQKIYTSCNTSNGYFLRDHNCIKCTCTSGTGAASCTRSVKSSSCSATATPKTGYQNAVCSSPDASGVITCTATPISYNIVYDANKPAGTSAAVTNLPSNTNCTYDAPCSVSTQQPKLEGWIFQGWMESKTGTTTTLSIVNGSTTNGGTKTLYAKWTAGRYTITYVSGTGTETNQDVTFGSEFTTYPNTTFTKTNSTFVNWMWSDQGVTHKLTIDSKYNYTWNTNLRVTPEWLCIGGYYLNGTTCTMCDAGTAKSNFGNNKTDCRQCQAGSYSDTAGSTSCTTCPKGSYCEGGTHIQKCPADTYNDKTGQTSATACKSCASGYTPNSLRTACIKQNSHVIRYKATPTGEVLAEFEVSLGSDVETATPEAIGASKKNASSTNYWFWSDQGGEHNVQAGYKITVNSDITLYTTWLCNPGFYLSGDTCVPCDAGTFKSATANDKAACLVCADNRYSYAGATSCTACAPGYENSGPNASNHNSVGTCKRIIQLNKNGGSGTINGATGTTVPSVTCSQDSWCNFPSAAGLTQTGYTFTGGWGTGSSCTSTTTSFKTPAQTTAQGANIYYACKEKVAVTCRAGEYLAKGTETCTACPAGKYCLGATYTFDTTKDQGITGNVWAGYYSSGGATFPAPTAPGNGCLSGNNCGLIGGSFYSTCGAVTEYPDAATSCLDGCSCGIVNAGFYSTGGGTSATPTTAGDGCVGGNSCGLISEGYYSNGGANSAKPSSSGSATNGCYRGQTCGKCPKKYPNSAAGAKSQQYCYLTLQGGDWVEKTAEGAKDCPAGKVSSRTDNIFYGPGDNNENKTTSSCFTCSGVGNVAEYAEAGSTQCKPCPDPFTMGGGGSISECFTIVNDPCSTTCPTGMTQCKFDPTQGITGHFWYYGTTKPTLQHNLCILVSFACAAGWYKDSSESCAQCSAVGDKSFTQSAANNTGDATACYKACTVPASCPGNASECTYDTTKKVYYNPSASVITECPILSVTCPAGYYKKSDGTCGKCEAGTYSTKGASTCTPCAEGTYSAEGADTCKPCSDGTYNTGTRNTQCEPCPAGKQCIGGHADDCSAGTFSTGDTASCTPCGTGSISGTASSSCTACQNGKTTTGTGQSSCNANCSVTASKWKTAIWNSSSNMVTNLCAPDNVTITCVAGKYIPQGQTTCNTTCPAGSFCPGVGSFTISASGATENKCIQACDKGKYSKDGATACTQCPAGSIAATTGQDKCTVCPAGTTTTGDDRTSCNKSCDNNSNVASWKTPTWDASNGNAINVCAPDTIYTSCPAGQYIKAGRTTCEPCPSGSYCAGFQNQVIPAAGATKDTGIVACPADSNAVAITSDNNRDAKTTCVAEYRNVAIPINDANKNGKANRTCHYSVSAYDTGCTIDITACNAGWYRQASDSTTCTMVPQGDYSPGDDIRKYPCPTDSRGATTDGQGAGIAQTSCYVVCNEQTLTDSKGKVSGRINASHQHYTGSAYPACPTTPSVCYPGYTAKGTECAPQILSINLVHSADGVIGSSPVNTIYLKYNQGWFSDSGASKSIGTIPLTITSDVLIRFNGYTMLNADGSLGEPITDDRGYLLTTDQALQSTTRNPSTAKAAFGTVTKIECNAGQYYPGTGLSCLQCPANSYCPGSETGYENSGKEAGRHTCQSLNGAYTAADNPSQTELKSQPGSTASTDCYATRILYTQANTTGRQSCYYNGRSTYDDRCFDITVTKCAAGYYLDKITDKTCKAVGKGYYSAKDILTRTKCPNLDENVGVTTENETSDTVDKCYIDNMWYENHDTVHGGKRRRCYHVTNASNTDITNGYSDNCMVGTIVTCDGGYYYATSNDSNCTPVGKGWYSPAQSEFTNEPLQPTSDRPGSSIGIYGCPEEFTSDTGSGTRKYASGTAADYAKCEYNFNCKPGFEGEVLIDSSYNATPTCGVVGPYCPAGFYGTKPNCHPCPCGGTSDGGEKAAAVSACYKEHASDIFKASAKFPDFGWKNGTGSARCKWSTSDNTSSCDTAYMRNCSAIAASSCIAGYYYDNDGSTSCKQVTNSCEYSIEGALTTTSCPTGCDKSAEGLKTSYETCFDECVTPVIPHANSVNYIEQYVKANSATSYNKCNYTITCAPGYTETNNRTDSPTCTPKTYTVILNKNGGTGDIAGTVTCTFDSACGLPSIGDSLSRTGYQAGTQWCTESNGTGKCFTAGQSIIENISSTGDSGVTLYAKWVPNVYQIKLEHNGGTANDPRNIAYLQYATGWFTGADATVPLNQLTAIPDKTGYRFVGYQDAAKKTIVSSTGVFLMDENTLTFTAEPATIVATWSASITTCDEGYYYSGTGSECKPCDDNYYCMGGDFATDVKEDGKLACPDGGKTAPNVHASSVEQCFKENLNSYVATHGHGTETCYYNNTAKGYITDPNRCWDRIVTECEPGYWQGETATPNDCVPVGRGYYSVAPMDRALCPNGGTTAENEITAPNITLCYKTDLESYEAINGSGTQTCFYNVSTKDYSNADTCFDYAITKCAPGYWLDEEKNIGKAKPDCYAVGTGYWSPEEATDKNRCPRYSGDIYGTTNTETAAEDIECYVDNATYDTDHGGGERSCHYKNGFYDDGCDEQHATITYCHGGYYNDNVYINAKGFRDCVEVGYAYWSPDHKSKKDPISLVRTPCGIGETTQNTTSNSANACYACYENEICELGKESTPCPTSHPYSDVGNSSINGCYNTDCVLEQNAAEMMGRIYYDKTSTCAIKYCAAGYKFNNDKTACIECGEGEFCTGPNLDPECAPNCPPLEPQSCKDLGDGSWPNSDKGASQPSDCYEKCETHEVAGCIAIKITDRSYYDKRCKYNGRDNKGNPSDIETVNDEEICIITACKPSYEMVNGECVPCNRDHAISYLPTGNCVVESCEIGYHPFTTRCEPDVLECNMPNAARAEARWDKTKNSYSGCTVVECNDGFHATSDNAACITDIEPCTVEHGVGEREWNHLTRTWGACKATSCDKGYTNDPTESNEPTKQCGNCRNKFGIKGEIAVEEYSSGCTISACMYQGERYALENGECIPICRDESDETGTMKWNPATKKCERKCNPGYVSW